MVAHLDHSAAVKHYDLVGILHRREAVGDNYHSASLIELCQVLHDGTFVLGIQCIGSLIKEDVFRIFLHRTCYEYALFLSLAEAHPIASYFGVEP